MKGRDSEFPGRRMMGIELPNRKRREYQNELSLLNVVREDMQLVGVTGRCRGQNKAYKGKN